MHKRIYMFIYIHEVYLYVPVSIVQTRFVKSLFTRQIPHSHSNRMNPVQQRFFRTRMQCIEPSSTKTQNPNAHQAHKKEPSHTRSQNPNAISTHTQLKTLFKAHQGTKSIDHKAKHEVYNLMYAHPTNLKEVRDTDVAEPIDCALNFVERFHL